MNRYRFPSEDPYYNRCEVHDIPLTPDADADGRCDFCVECERERGNLFYSPHPDAAAETESMRLLMLGASMTTADTTPEDSDG